MGERLSDAEEVGGSKPPEPTIYQLASDGGAHNYLDTGSVWPRLKKSATSN